MNKTIIGLIPAAGLANRIAPLPLSKEIFPVGFCSNPGTAELRPKAAIHYLVDKMAIGGITQVYVVLRRGKWDIPTYLDKTRPVGLPMAYLLMKSPFGAPFSLMEAYPFVKGHTIALGFPDILFEAQNVYGRLLHSLRNSNADVLLGLFPARHVETVDMVAIGQNQKVENILIKPGASSLKHTWAVAVWRPTFTEFMHCFLHQIMPECKAKYETDGRLEVYMGDVLNAAIRHGLDVRGISVSDKPFLDIGTPNDLVRAVQMYGSKAGEQTPPTST